LALKPALVMDETRLNDLIGDLRSLSDETEWVEFKVDNLSPDVIGKRISALSNGARLRDKTFGYLVYGIENETHNIVGTKFKGEAHKIKGQPIKLWLSNSMAPCPEINFYQKKYDVGTVTLIEIAAAKETPVKFSGTAYI